MKISSISKQSKVHYFIFGVYMLQYFIWTFKKIQIDNFNLMSFFGIVMILWHVNAWHSTKHCNVMQKMIHLMLQQPYMHVWHFVFYKLNFHMHFFILVLTKVFFAINLLSCHTMFFLKVASKFCIERLKQLYPPQWMAINFIALHCFATFGQIYVYYEVHLLLTLTLN